MYQHQYTHTGILDNIKTSMPYSFSLTVLASTSLSILLKSSLSTLKKWELFSRVMMVAERRLLFTSDNLPKSSPSDKLATTPLPWMDTSTDPFKIMYHESPSSPWLNTFEKVKKKDSVNFSVERNVSIFFLLIVFWYG